MFYPSVVRRFLTLLFSSPPSSRSLVSQAAPNKGYRQHPTVLKGKVAAIVNSPKRSSTYSRRASLQMLAFPQGTAALNQIVNSKR
jgi:hypothetical protein